MPSRTARCNNSEYQKEDRAMEQPDAVLLERWVERRDAEAMAEIVARHSRMVYSTCRRILGSGAEAADATQECFLRLATVRRAGPSLPGLLHTTATRLSLNHLRAESRRRERERRYVETLDPAQEARWDDVQTYVDEAIEGLDETLRGPIVRHFLEGETHETIARDLGLSRAGVSYRIDRGIREVRERLRRKGIAGSSRGP
ncbi:MAG: sigma-70 family RNA polymerase sigma factor [Candidatus Hydrogenedentes bacterium]|nr:sigma-70 family RNA polymerase sigma factor [Candidatus Hydrogenedentota bacterium]